MSINGSEDSIRANIVGKTYVSIQRLNNSIDWEHPIHAINWFNTRQLHVYNFYNLIATRSVKKVGGIPLFKGRLMSRLYGSDEDQRQVLLLVKYPAPINFKRMLENPYFKLVSIVRVVAVREFTFCLSHAVDEGEFPQKTNGSEQYGVHHFRGDVSTLELIRASLANWDINIHFSSMKSHELFSVTGKDEAVPVPVVMDGIVLFKCKDEDGLKHIVESKMYQDCIQQSQSSYVGLYKRIM